MKWHSSGADSALSACQASLRWKAVNNIHRSKPLTMDAPQASQVFFLRVRAVFPCSRPLVALSGQGRLSLFFKILQRRKGAVAWATLFVVEPQKNVPPEEQEEEGKQGEISPYDWQYFQRNLFEKVLFACGQLKLPLKVICSERLNKRICLALFPPVIFHRNSLSASASCGLPTFATFSGRLPLLNTQPSRKEIQHLQDQWEAKA